MAGILGEIPMLAAKLPDFILIAIDFNDPFIVDIPMKNGDFS